jgi:hypothetical protein
MMKKPKFLMMLKAKQSRGEDMGWDMGPDMDDEYEDEAGGFERDGMRIAAADLIQAVRSGNEIKAMDALETFFNLCKKG